MSYRASISFISKIIYCIFNCIQNPMEEYKISKSPPSEVNK